MRTFAKTRAATICVLAILLTPNTACRRIPKVRVTECEVFSAFIDAKFPSQKGMEPVILNMTESDEQGMNLRMDGNGRPIPWAQISSQLQSKAPTLKQTTIDAFRDVNRHQASFQTSLHPVIDYELVESSELEAVFKSGSWPAFYKRFPRSRGILRFSRIGFGEDGSQALFYVSNTCGGLCGVGEYLVMERQDRRWVIAKEIEMWIS
jgi:hypothetical protein